MFSVAAQGVVLVNQWFVGCDCIVSVGVYGVRNLCLRQLDCTSCISWFPSPARNLRLIYYKFHI